MNRTTATVAVAVLGIVTLAYPPFVVVPVVLFLAAMALMFASPVKLVPLMDIPTALPVAMPLELAYAGCDDDAAHDPSADMEGDGPWYLPLVLNQRQDEADALVTRLDAFELAATPFGIPPVVNNTTEIRRLFAAGETKAGIARKLKVTAHAVRKALAAEKPAAKTKAG